MPADLAPVSPHWRSLAVYCTHPVFPERRSQSERASQAQIYWQVKCLGIQTEGGRLQKGTHMSGVKNLFLMCLVLLR